MAEIARVLKPGGRCLSTFFLLNAEATELLKSAQGAWSFKHEGTGHRSLNAKSLEDAVALPEAFVRRCFEENGMRVETPSRYGSWCGRAQFQSFQDIVIAVKCAAE
jgi:hypothetical protein